MDSSLFLYKYFLLNSITLKSIIFTWLFIVVNLYSSFMKTKNVCKDIDHYRERSQLNKVLSSKRHSMLRHMFELIIFHLFVFNVSISLLDFLKVKKERKIISLNKTINN
jgi:hypothetical protein